jgi:thymidine kinase
VNNIAHFTFIFGAMGSTKTRELLSTDWNFRVDCGLDSYAIKPSKDTRDGYNIIRSRDGGERIADLVAFPHTDIFKEVEKRRPDIILVDEIQFMDKHHIQELRKAVDQLDIPVIGYGIKNDAFNEMFEGAKYAFLYADKFKQIKTVCRLCMNTATMNMRLLRGKPIFYGQQVQVGGNDTYIPVCSKCYHKLKEDSQREE